MQVKQGRRFIYPIFSLFAIFLTSKTDNPVFDIILIVITIILSIKSFTERDGFLFAWIGFFIFQTLLIGNWVINRFFPESNLDKLELLFIIPFVWFVLCLFIFTVPNRNIDSDN